MMYRKGKRFIALGLAGLLAVSAAASIGAADQETAQASNTEETAADAETAVVLAAQTQDDTDEDSTNTDADGTNSDTGSTDTTGEEAGKEEVVYVKLDAAGAVEEINVVNIWGSGEITDYGAYEEVKMLTTTDEITQDGDEITFTTEADRVYYQGTLSADTQLPWLFSIQYYLDGEAVTTQEIAGASGELRIILEISENPDCDLDFYDGYALQISLTLDTALCSNIVAEDATIANVGSDKQLTYTVLPGKGLDTEITADVTDFEMDSISINGVQMSLNIEVDSSELSDKVQEITDAVDELNDGAAELDDGASEMLEGTQSLKEGSDSLYSGAKSLDEGVAELQDGMNTLEAGLQTLTATSSDLTSGSAEVLAALTAIEDALSGISASTEEIAALAEASGQIALALEELEDGAVQLQTNLGYAQYTALMASYGVDIDTLIAGNTQAAEQIEELVPLLETVSGLLSNPVIAAYAENYGITAEDVSQLETLAETLTALLAGDNAALAGLEAYLDSVSDGVDELAEGVETLNANYQTFHESIETLVELLSDLLTQMETLRAAIQTLTDSYEELDDGITDYTDGVASVAAGYQQLLSGVSALAEGSASLLEGSEELTEGVLELYEGTEELCSGTTELLDGTTEFVEEVADLDTEVEDQIDSMISEITGEDVEVVSFVSEKNTNVESVLFVITVESIEAEEAEETDAQETGTEEETTLWDRIRDLFL